jgi:hypothetical protein
MSHFKSLAAVFAVALLTAAPGFSSAEPREAEKTNDCDSPPDCVDGTPPTNAKPEAAKPAAISLGRRKPANAPEVVKPEPRKGPAVTNTATLGGDCEPQCN